MFDIIKTWLKKITCEHSWEYDYSSNIPEYRIDFVHQKCKKCGKTRRIAVPDYYFERY